MKLLETLHARRTEHQRWRRHLHAHPETAFEEYKTAAFVAEKLREFGMEVETGIAKTGVVGTLTGQTSGGAIALRADMDALNMTERADLPHRSQTPGKMHACGHDGHTVMLLAAAEHLAKTRDFAGVIYFVFQPAEENEGGGRAMVEDGFFDRFPASEVYGMHNWPALPAGKIAVHTGPVMASADRFTIRILGRGGHGAMPHQTHDPILAAAHLITTLQSIVSRDVAPSDSAVVSVTRVDAGETYNVIPGSAELWGTARSFSPSTRDALEARIRETASGIGTALGVQIDVEYRRGYPATVNAPMQAQIARSVANEVVGEDQVLSDLPPSMGAEDFSYFLNERPGCYIWLGTGRSDADALLHHPEYDFNDNMLPVGAAYWVHLAKTRLDTLSID